MNDSTNFPESLNFMLIFSENLAPVFIHWFNHSSFFELTTCLEISGVFRNTNDFESKGYFENRCDLETTEEFRNNNCFEKILVHDSDRNEWSGTREPCTVTPRKIAHTMIAHRILQEHFRNAEISRIEKSRYDNFLNDSNKVDILEHSVTGLFPNFQTWLWIQAFVW
jgi:hypothetical protein